MRTVPKGPNRIKVEEALMRGTVSNPIDAVQVAGISGVHITLCRTYIGNAVAARLAYNLNPGHRGCAQYVWGKPPEASKAGRFVPTGTYTGQPAAATRPGAMDAYSLPSLIDGVCIERRRPILIGAVGMVR